MSTEQDFLDALVTRGQLTPEVAAKLSQGSVSAAHAGSGGWAAGQQVGAYRLERLLGKGGMGEVWQVTHLPTGGQRALKSLLGFAGVDDYARFQREAESLARLDHPNVVRVHEAGQHQRRAYLVMDLAQGDLLSRLEGRPLPPGEVRRVTLALADALAAVHAQGLLHRDLKPHNVLFADDGSPQLADFGLAQVAGLERLTRTGELLGTPAYMAPEQVLGTGVDERTDVYGLGALMYHALCGHPPVSGTNPVAVLQQVVEATPPAPSRVRPEVSPELDAICLRALAKDPAQRFPSARAFAAALRGEAGAVSTRRPRPWQLLLLSVLLGGGGFAVFHVTRSAPPHTGPDPRAVESAPAPPAEPEVAEVPSSAGSLDPALALERGLELRWQGDPQGSVPYLERALASELSLERRIEAGLELIKSLTDRVTVGFDAGELAARTERAEEVFEELAPLVEVRNRQLQVAETFALGHRYQRESRKRIDLQRSRLLVLRGEHDAALKLAQQIQRHHPDSPAAVLQLAECLVHADAPEEALVLIRDFHRGGRDPSPLLLEFEYGVLGQLQLRAEQDAVAEQLLSCSSKGGFFKHARRARERGDYDAASAEYTRLAAAGAELSLSGAERRLRLAFLLGSKDTERYARQVLARAPNSVNALVTYAQHCLLRRGRHRDVLELTARCLEIQPEHAFAEVMRAESLRGLQRWQQGRRAAERALKLDPTLAETTLVLWYLADCQLNLADAAGFRQSLERIQGIPQPYFQNLAKALAAHAEAVNAARKR